MDNEGNELASLQTELDLLRRQVAVLTEKIDALQAKHVSEESCTNLACQAQHGKCLQQTTPKHSLNAESYGHRSRDESTTAEAAALLHRQLQPASVALEIGSLPSVPQTATRVVMHRVVLPSEVDRLGMCFGGQVLSWVDVCAGLSAKTLARRPCVTATLDAVHFLRPCRLGTVVIIAAMVNRTFNSSMEVGVRVEAEDMYSGQRYHCCSAYLTFVAQRAAPQRASLTGSPLYSNMAYNNASNSIMSPDSSMHGPSGKYTAAAAATVNTPLLPRVYATTPAGGRVYEAAGTRRQGRLAERNKMRSDPELAQQAELCRLKPITHREGGPMLPPPITHPWLDPPRASHKRATGSGGGSGNPRRSSYRATPAAELSSPTGLKSAPLPPLSRIICVNGRASIERESPEPALITETRITSDEQAALTYQGSAVTAGCTMHQGTCSTREHDDADDAATTQEFMNASGANNRHQPPTPDGGAACVGSTALPGVLAVSEALPWDGVPRVTSMSSYTGSMLAELNKVNQPHSKHHHHHPHEDYHSSYQAHGQQQQSTHRHSHLRPANLAPIQTRVLKQAHDSHHHSDSADSGIDSPVYTRKSSIRRSRCQHDVRKYPISPSLTEAYMTQSILPQHANTLGITFGGQVMSWMEMCAYISASRLRAPHLLTAAVDSLTFARPTCVGDILYLTSQVTAIFGSSLEVQVSVHGENPQVGELFHCADGYYTMVAVSEPDSDDEEDSDEDDDRHKPAEGEAEAEAGHPDNDSHQQEQQHAQHLRTSAGRRERMPATPSGAGNAEVREALRSAGFTGSLAPVKLPFVLDPQTPAEVLRGQAALKRRDERLQLRAALHQQDEQDLQDQQAMQNPT